MPMSCIRRISLWQKTHRNFLVPLVAFSFGFAGGVIVGKLRGVPFVDMTWQWSIGIYAGSSPLNLNPLSTVKNPVLTARDVTDVPAEFIADPFMIKEASTWYMFFEVLNKHTNQGDIGLAASDDGLHWKYRSIVLDEKFHLAYPYVFKVDNKYYLMPASHKGPVRLYEAVDFPTRWEFVANIIDEDVVDSSVVRYDDKWWLFASNAANDMLHLYYADELTGPWKKHPQNPVVKENKHAARPGGRIIVFDGRIIRFVQDDAGLYGNRVRAFEITELTTSSFKQHELKESPLLEGSGRGWNALAMHTLDPHQIDTNLWIACVDGYGRHLIFGLNR